MKTHHAIVTGRAVMRLRNILSISAIAAFGLALMPGSAFAQTAKDIVGTWKTVTNISTAPDGRRTV
jgi:hypothetical protein